METDRTTSKWQLQYTSHLALGILLAMGVASNAPGQAAGSGTRQPGAKPEATQRGYVPRHERIARRVASSTPSAEVHVAQSEVVVGGPVEEFIVSQQPPITSELAAGCGCDSGACDGGACGEISCGEIDCGGCASCCAGCNFNLFAGVHGFKNPSNRGEDGSFGFHMGFNWAGSAWPVDRCGWNVQLGLQSVLSNFSGADFSPDDRSQFFLTAGLFRRVHNGLQGGLVLDYLRDDWYYKIDVNQLRGELSWVWAGRQDVGFWFAANTGRDTSVSRLFGTAAVRETWETSDLYAFFYRRQLCECGPGETRLYAGFTGDSDGLIGADALLPLSACWALESSFAYLIPNEGTGVDGHEQESWNVAMNLVWYPGRNMPGACGRPLFRVADNGSMMIRRR